MDNRIKELNNKYSGKNIGITASCFDLLHAGHMLMLKEAKNLCDVLIVALQTDPTIDRPEKNKPIQSYDERCIIIDGNKYVDDYITYSTEKELLYILKNLRIDIRILGNDYIDINFTGFDLPIKVHFHNRKTHTFSTSNLRKKIYNIERQKYGPYPCDDDI
jgi:glycerol-3-phosphate cytidylyltransferase|tara:strand:- start:115 stop:597 length:483 start_codon:yes stop_codon:yes gene_type:complete